MGRQDVERALRAMDDHKIRERLSQDDFEAVSGLDLTDQERTLVRNAAGDYPEVAGFSFETFSASVELNRKDKWIPILQSGIGDKFQLAWKYTLGG